MKLAKDLALLALLAALALAGVRLALLFATAQRVTEQLPAIINLQAEETRGALTQALDRVAGRAEAQIALTRVAAVAEIQASRQVLSGDLGALAGVADARLASVQSDLNTHGLILEQLAARELGRAGDQVEAIGTELQATLAESRRTVHDLHPQLLGLVAASKVAAGEIATSGREFQRAAPRLLANVDRITANSDRATAASARIAENFAQASKPLPKWLRIVLAIAPPVASTGASAAAAGAAIGVFR